MSNEDFTRLYLAHYTVIYKAIYNMVHNRELTEDLTQETFVKAYKSRESIDVSNNIGGLLYRIAVHSVYDYHKSQHNKENLPLEESYATSHEPVLDDIAETYERQVTIREALAMLPLEIQNVFILRLRGYSYISIAREMHTTDRTLRSKVAYYRKVIQHTLAS